jgi:hypothetical protein
VHFEVAQEIKARIDKLDQIKLKHFCTAKEITTRIKKWPTEWETVFVIYLSDRKIIART